MLTNRFHVGFNAIEIFKHYETSIILILSKITAKMDSIENGALTVFLNNSNKNNNNNNIKCERLSPRTNGDFHTERSRSATPSSYSGTSPQPQNFNDISGRNLTSNILLGNDTNGGDLSSSTTRNYSDFMRSLAAKYNNNNNTNDITKLPNIETNNLINPRKECTTESARLKQCNSDQNISTNVAPLVSSLISRLQFSSQNVFPPLIDMSSTQALVTLARVAKEIEIQKILKTPQQNISTLNDFSSTSTALKQQLKLKRSSKSSPTNLIENNNNNIIPLDLSSAQIKRAKFEFSPNSRSIIQDVLEDKCTEQQQQQSHQQQLDNNNEIIKINSNHCQAQSEEINSWTVDDVCDFVGSINICAEYVENFRDQCIDGLGLPLLTEGHLTNSLGMKLGPALKLRLLLAKKLGGPCPCVSCINQNTLLTTATTSSSSSLKYLNNNINSKKKSQSSRPSSTDSGS